MGELQSSTFDIAVIGGGAVGLATAMTIVSSYRGRVVVIEAEDRVAAHQTGNNSGVIHSGLYYKPGSLKARNCVEGRLAKNPSFWVKRADIVRSYARIAGAN